jgi:two-component system chemotaxis response regulator CheB
VIKKPVIKKPVPKEPAAKKLVAKGSTGKTPARQDKKPDKKPGKKGAAPLEVVVVEGNRTQCNLLRRVLEAEGDMAVTGTAATAAEAAEVVRARKPAVVTLDLQIEGGGIEAISQIMGTSPRPVLVLSVAVQGVWADRAVEALAAGAADVLPKPVRWDKAAEAELRDRVRAMGRVRLSAAPPATPAVPPPPPAAPAPTGRVVAMAASTGGPPALARVLSELGGLEAPVLLVQHLHPDFMGGFVSWLNRMSALPVKAARAGERIKAGTVYVAPGRTHLRLGPAGVLLLDAKPVLLHTPSADVLFSSVAHAAGPGAVGVLLTGMGADGAAGLLDIKEAGGAAIAQDEATSAVFGMPNAALRVGAAHEGVALERIASAVRSAVAKSPRRRAAR